LINSANYLNKLSLQIQAHSQYNVVAASSSFSLSNLLC
jgi:hypothetical protein